jgi:hypothetical protein
MSLPHAHQTNTVLAIQHAPIDDAGFSIAASSAMLESDLFSEARMQAIRRNIARGRAVGPQSKGRPGREESPSDRQTERRIAIGIVLAGRPRRGPVG